VSVGGGVVWSVASAGHRTHPAGHHREPQSSVQHRRRPHVTAGRGQQPSRQSATTAGHQLRHPAAVHLRRRSRRRGSAATSHRRLVVRRRWRRRWWVRGGFDAETIARAAACDRVDVVEYRPDVTQEQQNVAVSDLSSRKSTSPLASIYPRRRGDPTL